MRSLLLLLGLVSATSLLTGCSDAPTAPTTVSLNAMEAWNSRVYLEDAADLYDQEAYDEALEKCNQFCQINPQDYEGLWLRTSIYVALERYEEALTEAHRVFELGPQELDSLKLRALAYSVNEQHELALADLNKIIEREPNFENFVDRGYEHEKLWDYAQAIDDYRQAVTLNPECAWGWNNYASILSMSADVKFRNGEAAKQYALKAVEFADDDECKCYAWDTLGSAMAELGDFDGALESAHIALPLAPSPFEVKQIQGHIAHYRRGEPVRYDPQPAAASTANHDH